MAMCSPGGNFLQTQVKYSLYSLAIWKFISPVCEEYFRNQIDCFSPFLPFESTLKR